MSLALVPAPFKGAERSVRLPTACVRARLRLALTHLAHACALYARRRVSARRKAARGRIDKIL